MSQSIMRSSSFKPCRPGKYSVRRPTPEEEHRHFSYYTCHAARHALIEQNNADEGLLSPDTCLTPAVCDEQFLKTVMCRFPSRDQDPARCACM